MSNLFDPSVVKADDNRTTMEETETQVSFAYDMGIKELKVILQLANFVQKPPGDDLEALKAYRDQVTKDVRRLVLRANISKTILKARDAQFHYQAKRLRTADRIDRLRLWNREQNQEMEIAKLQGGDKGLEAVRRRLEEEKRVMIKCYNLESLWEKAMRREKSTNAQEDDLSSDCETSMEG
ncbi:hypothetical protein F66182_9250 [Fusarium sp. NRRL 66182]|nr:hypothetical protein F66182_9250 [Fusarium sp. NRRL 66182]